MGNTIVMDGQVPVYITEGDLGGGDIGDLVLVQIYPTWVLGPGTLQAGKVVKVLQKAPKEVTGQVAIDSNGKLLTVVDLKRHWIYII